MANTKTGLNYYTVDTDRYQDRRIKRLKKDLGCKGIAVYDYILCEIYREHGCFLEWDANTAFDVAEYFGMKEEVVLEIVKYCGSVGLFEKGLLSRGIITSASIQRRYMDMCVRAKRKVVIIPEQCAIEGVGIRQPRTQARKKDVCLNEAAMPRHDTYTLTLEQEIEEMKADECWLDQLQLLHHINTDMLRGMLDEFRLQCIGDGKDRHTSMQDAKHHFNSWLRIVNNKSKVNDDTDRQRRSNQRRGNILKVDEPKTYGDTF